MKILFVNFNIGGFAGDSGQIPLIAKYLLKLGHHVTIVTTDGDIFFYDKKKSIQYSKIRQKLQNAHEKIIEINDIPVLPVHCITEKIGLYCPNASKIAKEILPKYDVVHIHNWYYHLGMTFAKIASEINFPFIVSANGSLQEKAHSLKSRQKWLADKLYTNKLIPKASILQSVGKLETEQYVKFGSVSEKIVRIDHGIDLNNFCIKEKTGIIEKFKINEPYLLFLSRIDKKKGLEILIESFKKIQTKTENLSLVIAGTGDEKYVKNIKTIVKNLDLDSYIKFTGYVTEQEKLELLKFSKFYVLTSHSDVHPIAVQDALAMGTPVLITKECDYPEISTYEAGLEISPTVDSITNGISTMLSDDVKLQNYSKNAKKLIKEKFLLESKISEYERMYEKAIANN